MKTLLAFVFLLIFDFALALPAYKVGILGAGIGGAAAAYHIRKDFPDAEITVFESRNYIGGRLKHMTIGGQVIELGGDAWSSVNQYMQGYAKNLNITLSNNTFEGNGKVGLWGSKGFIDLQEVLATHADDVLKLEEQLEQFKLKLKLNYDERDAEDIPYQTVTNFTKHGDLDQYTNISTIQFVNDEDFPAAFYNNTILPLTMGIYDQNLDINNFAGIVSILPFTTDGYSVAGGNSLLVEQLFNESGATIYLSSPVETIATSPLNGYTIKSNSTSVRVDAFVIASPIEYINVSFVNIDLPDIVPRDFVYWYVTVVEATGINPEFFGKPAGTVIPDNILTTEGSTLPFVTLSIEAQADNGALIYKTFSNVDMTPYLSSLFLNVSYTFVQHWPYTFPNLNPLDTYQPIILADGLFYQNAIESLASAMECSAIAGRNSAQLVRDYYVTRF